MSDASPSHVPLAVALVGGSVIALVSWGLLLGKKTGSEVVATKTTDTVAVTKTASPPAVAAPESTDVPAEEEPSKATASIPNEPVAPALTEIEAPPGTSSGSAPKPFDKSAALATLRSIAYKDCGGIGVGSVVIVFNPSGTASSVSVSMDGGDAGAKSCVAKRFRAAHVPAFDGSPTSVKWHVSF